MEAGTIVLGITYDEPATNLGLIMDYLISVNLNVSIIKFRGKFTFAWQKGFPEKSIVSVRNGKIPLSTLVAFNSETIFYDCIFDIKFIKIASVPNSL